MKRLRRGWNALRGELVEIPGLIGDFLIDWGEALDGWTRRHRWSKRDLEELEADRAALVAPSRVPGEET
jgi:hypothetical protein